MQKSIWGSVALFGLILLFSEVSVNADDKKDEKDKKEVLHLTYPGESLAEFEALFANAPASSIKKTPPVSFEGLGG